MFGNFSKEERDEAAADLVGTALAGFMSNIVQHADDPDTGEFGIHSFKRRLISHINIASAISPGLKGRECQAAIESGLDFVKRTLTGNR